MRASRLISLLLLLQQRGHMTGAELASELEVSVRTIYRDLEALARAHVPVVTERGPGGGCRLLGGYRTRLTGLSGEEAGALFLSGVPDAAAELGLGSLLAAAQLKLSAALPEPVREAARLAQQRFHVDVAGWFETPIEHPALPPAAEAVFAGRRVELLYARGDGTRVERRLDPLGLVLKGRLWYLVGNVEDATRSYRVSRIERLAILDERFSRPPHFDLAAFWASARREFESGRDYLEVRVRLSPAGVHQLSLLDNAVTRAPSDPPPVLESDGWQRRILVFERLDWAENRLLRLGADVEVLEPEALRSRLAITACRLAELYRDALTPDARAPMLEA